jgi:hypothetical protein
MANSEFDQKKQPEQISSTDDEMVRGRADEVDEPADDSDEFEDTEDLDDEEGESGEGSF